MENNFLLPVKMFWQGGEHWHLAENSTPLNTQLLKKGLILKHENLMFSFKPLPGLKLHILYLYSRLSSS